MVVNCWRKTTTLLSFKCVALYFPCITAARFTAQLNCKCNIYNNSTTIIICYISYTCSWPQPIVLKKRNGQKPSSVSHLQFQRMFQPLEEYLAPRISMWLGMRRWLLMGCWQGTSCTWMACWCIRVGEGHSMSLMNSGWVNYDKTVLGICTSWLNFLNKLIVMNSDSLFLEIIENCCKTLNDHPVA